METLNTHISVQRLHLLLNSTVAAVDSLPPGEERRL